MKYKKKLKQVYMYYFYRTAAVRNGYGVAVWYVVRTTCTTTVPHTQVQDETCTTLYRSL